MTNISEQIKKYYLAAALIKDYTAEKNQLNKELKEAMTASGDKAIELDGYKAVLGCQTRVTMREEEVIEYLKGKGSAVASRAIKVREVLDTAAVEELVYEGVLSAAELEPFLSKTEVQILTVKKVKGGE